MGRKNRINRVILACDGTWLASGTGNDHEISNVTNFCRALKSQGKMSNKGTRQVVFYQSGVGTGAGYLQKLLAGSTGAGLEDNMREAYVFLSDNYRLGDEVFLFGFSRGAYTVRTIASLIGNIGILNRHGMQHFRIIYDMYKSAKSIGDWKQSFNHFIKWHGLEPGSTSWRVAPENVIIKAVGCWDTVGALGVPKNFISNFFGINDKYEFLDTQLPPRVEHAFHALALDEHRSSFYPSIWWLDPDAQAINDHKGNTIEPELIQCWFPGHHNELGGQAPGRKISNLALAWLVDQCISKKLLNFDIDYLKSSLVDTRNEIEPDWGSNTDPFYGGILPTAMWKLLGSRVRKPGREPLPKGWKPVTEGSKTFEYIHYSLREKTDALIFEEINEGCSDCEQLEVPPPSRSMKHFEYCVAEKSWVTKNYKVTRPELRIEEFPRPASDDKESLQAWLSSDWLRMCEAKEHEQMTKIQSVTQ